LDRAQSDSGRRGRLVFAYVPKVKSRESITAGGRKKSTTQKVAKTIDFEYGKCIKCRIYSLNGCTMVCWGGEDFG